MDHAAVELVAALEERVLVHRGALTGARVLVDAGGVEGRLEVAEGERSVEGDEVLLAVVRLVGTDFRLGLLRHVLHEGRRAEPEQVVRRVDVGERSRVRGVVVRDRVAVEHPIGVVAVPRAPLGRGRVGVANAVDAIAGIRAEVRRGGLARQRHQRFDRLVALEVVGPLVEPRPGLAEEIGRVLVPLALLDRDGVASPVDPPAHAVGVEVLLVAGERAGTDAGASRVGEDGEVDLLAAVLQLIEDTEDRGQVGALVGREEVAARPLLDEVLLVDGQLVVGGNRGESHGSDPFV